MDEERMIKDLEVLEEALELFKRNTMYKTYYQVDKYDNGYFVTLYLVPYDSMKVEKKIIWDICRLRGMHPVSLECTLYSFI